VRKKEHERPWLEEFKDLFSIHAGERNGIIILMALCFVASGWVIYEQYVAPDEVKDKAALEVAWAQLKTEEGSAITGDQRSDRQAVEQKLVLFKFDPNHLPLEQWVTLGLSERQASTILKYEAKGGRFRTKHDLAKMFVVDPELFAQWEPYIQLPDELPHKAFAEHGTNPEFQRKEASAYTSTAPKQERNFAQPSVELNAADTTQLVAVRGIGPAFARSIVKFRDRVGGFHSLDQLSEVYILRDKPEAVAELKNRLMLDTLMVHRFPLNTFTAEELGPHPYAGWKVAKVLVAYRKLHGPFKTVADIKGCMLVTDSVYRKLAPYLIAE
jgi:competence protein ComEA